jgi:hypothetical protein
MKRLAAFWLALALLIGSGWAGPVVRAGRSECVWVARRANGLAREVFERLVTHRARVAVEFPIPSNASFVRIPLFVYALFQRPPTSLIFSFI